MVFPISGWSCRFRQIGELAQAGSKIEVDALDITGQKEYIPGDTFEPGEVDYEFFFDTANPPPEPHELDTPIVTYPLRAGETTPLSYTGSGFFLNRIIPMLKNGELQMGKGKFAYDGKATPVTVTNAA
jgi:hypothetical protein